MGNATVRNFHLPLPADLYEELRREARRRGRPATTLARRAIETCLKEARRAAVHEEIVSYARKHAGTRTDLDTALEGAAVQLLLDSED